MEPMGEKRGGKTPRNKLLVTLRPLIIFVHFRCDLVTVAVSVRRFANERGLMVRNGQ